MVSDAFQKVFSQAFTLQTLERMVMLKLRRDLYDYAAPGDKQQVVFELLGAADRQGFLEQLVLGAREFNPGNEALRDLACAYGLESTRRSTLQLQTVIDATKPSLAPAEFREKIFEAELRVCRVEIPVNGDLVRGTGFLVADSLVMTNYHVAEPLITGQVAPAKARVRFDFKATPTKTVNTGTVVGLADPCCHDWSEVGPLEEPSPNQLDYAILRLAAAPPPLGEAQRGAYQLRADAVEWAEHAPLFIMQHPAGRQLELAMDTDAVLGANGAGTRVRYRTRTEHGSSGSPCFTPDFELVALHQAGDPAFTDRFNQGVPISAIVELLRGRGKAAELGL
jgi:hypothetical protein